ncbi:berberine bridge enzyme-like 22 [Salvia splendens]|uniref:berberine bridge enzyme-like 22 n=1 Tax=Salvia splendens TaxID=180675 RepID=UPI001C27171E|nr:berberine bridge enzyme-like 22 [Salvia splendens]
MASHMLQHILLYLSILIGCCSARKESFVECVSNQSSSVDTKISLYIYTPHCPSYSNLLNSSMHNPRWINSVNQRPKFIVTPTNNDQIKAAITCARAHGFGIRVLSGGHDYEGLSFRSKSRFVLVDLVNLNSITINMDDETAWVQAGATIGELYYNIANKSNTHAFPAGLYPSVGVGGHFSGGGIGTLMRKYGLASDNILDAKIMNVDGEVLDRESMGEDLFWAIRGGGGASFGVILAWRIRLVRVPPVTTVFTVRKDLDDAGIEVVDKWQKIAHKLPNDLFIRVLLQNIAGKNTPKPKFARANFNSLFLGNAKDLLALVETVFPELGLQEADCKEMSWINTTLYFPGKTDQPYEALLDRAAKATGGGNKGKSDFATRAIPKSAYHGINQLLLKEDLAFVIMDPFGGKIDEIGENETAFPHRKGNLFNLQYLNIWGEGEGEKKHLEWSREVYEFMEPYVSSSPRGAYLNYRDLDLGFQKRGEQNYSRARVWGERYFKGNFERLAKVKKRVDPDNFFGDEQSVPPIS